MDMAGKDKSPIGRIQPIKRCTNQNNPSAAMRPEAAERNWLFHRDLPTKYTSGKMSETKASCPSSTPPLKENSEIARVRLVRAICLSTFEKPKPWTRPKRKVIFHLCKSVL